MKALPFFLSISAPGLVGICQATTPEELVAGTTARIEALFQADSGKAFVPAKVRASLAGGRPYYSRHYSWSVAGFAARCFHLNQMLPEANAALIQNGKFYLRQLTPAEEASILDPNARTESNTGQYARITNRDSVHWHADILLRLIDMFGTNGSVAPGRMSADAEAKSLEYIWQYVRLLGRVERAEFALSQTWYYWGSENHHAMDFRTHWHFSRIAKERDDYKDLTTDFGDTPEQLYEAYNDYFIEYVRERFRKGLFVEMMSKGYNSATYTGLYNFYDFGNPEVKEHARMLLDLFWAYYAQEQINDVVGGGAARVDFDDGLTAGHAGTTGEFAWFYFGMVGQPPAVDGRSVNAYFSSYRPPAVIADIATDIAGRGTYEIKQTAQGLGRTGGTNADLTQNNTPHRADTDGGGIVRYSYCNPAFIMGLPMVEARPMGDWLGISTDNRWQGVIFPDPDNDAARIVPCVQPNSGNTSANQHWGVQSKGSMITQMLNTHSGGKEMWVWISKEGLNADPAIEDTIVFVDIAGAYAAIRVAGATTTYTLHEDYKTGIPPHFVVRPTDKFAPVILEVMAKTEVADFAAFKQLVKTNTPGFSNGLVTYTTIYGDALTFDSTNANNPTINGVPVDYSPEKSFDSPFLHGNYNGDTFVIEKGARQEIYSWALTPPPSITGFSPADNSANVATDANLTLSFSEAISAETGLITLKNLTDNTQSTIGITDATQVSISGATLTINPTNNLLNGKAYAIQIASGAVENMDGTAFPGIDNNTTWNFTTVAPPDTTPPLISTLNPADNATGASAFANLVATFNEPVQAGTGNIVLKKSSDNSTVQTFDVTTNVVFSGSQITMNPSSDLEFGTQYYVEIAPGAVKDLSGNGFAGLSGNGAWNFTTVASVQTQPISVANGGFTNAGDITVIASAGIQNLGSATTGVWHSGTGAKANQDWDANGGLAKLGGDFGNAVALFQVIEVGGDVSSTSSWTFSFDLASTAGAVIGDQIGVGIYTWDSDVDTAPTIDLADSNVALIWTQTGAAQNGAKALLTEDGLYDNAFVDGQVIANQGGLTVGAEGGTYSFDFTLDANDDRVAIIFSGRHKNTAGADAFSIDNVAITSQAAAIPVVITSFSVDTVTDTATINFRAAPNTSYICKSSTDLISFPTTETAINGTSFDTGADTGDGTGIGTAEVDISTAGDKRFYRLETP